MAHDHTQARPERTTPTLAKRVPWSRMHEHAPERPDDRVPSPLTACSLSRRPSLPKSLKPHGSYRLECPQIVSTDVDGLTCKTPFAVRTSGVAASAEHVGRLEEEGRGNGEAEGLGRLE